MASPEPQRILEIHSVRLLLEAGVIVVCAGGGGVPVVEDGAGGWRGVEAVVDKDLSAALLAIELDADGLLLLTDVDAVYQGWGTDLARPIREATPSRLRAQSFAPGSMGPKVEAACRFVEGRGSAGHPAREREAWIGALDDAAEIVAGRTGTHVVIAASPH